MIQIKRCPLCGELFVPGKFHPKQQYCSSSACRQARKKDYKSEYNRNWREQNPDYYKEYWMSYRASK